MRRFMPVFLLFGCNRSDGDGSTTDQTEPLACQLTGAGTGCEAPPSSDVLGCQADFDALASLPLDASIPGARSVKTVVDQAYGDTLYFMNSVRYPIHWEFASDNLNAEQGFAPVGDLSAFNLTEYYSPERRFVLGAVVYYAEPDLWTYEVAPYDTASADMVAKAFHAIRDHAFFGDKLAFHPSSETQENDVVPALPPDIPIITTDQLFAGVEYQSYNPGETTGLLTFHTAAEVDGGYTPYRELVVLDDVPVDISIVAGIITSAFQTPLAHINVLSINRGTPNMALVNAQSDPRLTALEGKWVRLKVDAFSWTIEEITQEEADTWWNDHAPPVVTVPPMDTTVDTLTGVEDVVVDGADLATEITHGLSIYGSKATNYAALYDIGAEVVPIQNGFVIPFHYYDAHMRNNGLRDQLVALMATPDWQDPTLREGLLLAFQADMVAAPLDPALLAAVQAEADARWPTENTRFRSSTNAEDLGDFNGAGLYNSQTGHRDVPNPDVGSVEWAIKEAWANLWNPRAYDERALYGINQLDVGMALLTTPNFEQEEANGVAITNNIFDTSGLEPAFFINAQIDDNEVVQPDPGVVSDTLLDYYYTPGEPVVYISHSTLVPPGTTVLDDAQIHTLSQALDAIHNVFRPVYGNDDEWYGMDVEWKYDDKYTPGTPQLFIKQARPLPWDPGAATLSTCETTPTAR